ncbi:MAG: peptidyl-prolyl cis-trans isomerase [Candidatus Latescibacterota bacterium]|nr:peptidyl-prolyl cis-trans isomerase [Candidatus Latescibacterota bacterium]
MIGKMYFKFSSVVFVFGIFVSCGEESEVKDNHKIIVPEGMLAVIGQQSITSEDLMEYEEEIQQVHRSQKKGYERHHDHLSSLVDEYLMVLRAEEQGLDKDPELKVKLGRVEHVAMIEAYLHETVGQNIPISEEELRENFNSHPARYAVRGAHILVSSQDRADSLYRLISSGERSFEELARAYSLDEKTAINGGDFGGYYAYDRVSDKVYQKVFSVEVGETSKPFRSPQGWEITKVLDRKLVPFEKYRTVILRATMMKKFNALKKSHIDSLQFRLNLKVNSQLLTRFISLWNENIGSPELRPEEFSKSMYTFDGGGISAENVMYLLQNTNLGQSKIDSAMVESRVREKGAPDLLLGHEARKQNYDKKQIVLDKVRKARHKVLLQSFWKNNILKDIKPTEADARKYYDNHPERFKKPAETVVQEILVATRTEAEDLVKLIRAGEDMSDLATRFSLRKFSDENGGLYAIRPFERLVYGELIDAVNTAELDELIGPVEITSPMPSTLREIQNIDLVYSVCRVLERIPERTQSFVAQQDRALFFAEQIMQQNFVSDMTKVLREDYADRWRISVAALQDYSQIEGKSKSKETVAD